LTEALQEVEGRKAMMKIKGKTTIRTSLQLAVVMMMILGPMETRPPRMIQTKVFRLI